MLVRRARPQTWRFICRATWIALMVLVVALFAAGVPVFWSHLEVVCSAPVCQEYGFPQSFAQRWAELGLSPAQVATYVVVLDTSNVVSYIVMSALLEWRRPDERMAQFAAFALLVFGGVTISDTVHSLGLASPALTPLIRGLSTFGAAGVATFFCIFPDGRFVPSWTRGVAALLFVTAAAGLVAPGSPLDLFSWTPLVAVPFAAVIVFAQLHRYRHAASVIQRQQMKWVVFGLIITAAAYTAYLSASDLLRPLTQAADSPLAPLVHLGVITCLALGLSVLPVCIGVAILRHQLFDIDRLVTGALVYGTLWLCITLAYVGLIAALGQVVGERLPVALSAALTLVVALLVHPARSRLERIADSWVFGARLGGYELLSRFGATLEQSFDLDVLAGRLATMIRQGLRVTWVRVLVRTGAGDLETVAADGIGLRDQAAPALVSPLMQADDRLGRIECGPKRRGDAFDNRDEELLATLGRQAALGLRNARLTGELARRLEELARQADELSASRTRIVQAEEAGRRRIERDIHDGVQQQLVALMAKARLARNQLGRDPARAGATLAELQEDARQTLQDLRDLAQGIHPAVLGDHGLVEALDARLARLPIDGRLEYEGLLRRQRFGADVEGAAYFVVSEALANTLKHANASQAFVRVFKVGMWLSIQVTDDGSGFDPNQVVRRGLNGAADRIEALGGKLQIESAAGAGTCLLVSLPATEHEPD